MKKKLLLILSFVLAANLYASDSGDNSTLSARILHNLLFGKKMAAAVESLNNLITEIKDMNIKFLRSQVVSDYCVGNTRYITTKHFYDGRGDVITVVNNYSTALNDLNTTTLLSAAGDGAILGLLAGIVGSTFKLDKKTAGIGIVLSSALLALAKSKQAGKVPYLTFPKLTSNDNYFGVFSTVGTFICLVGVGAASYFGTSFLLDVISGKISAVKDAIQTN